MVAVWIICSFYCGWMYQNAKISYWVPSISTSTC